MPPSFGTSEPISALAAVGAVAIVRISAERSALRRTAFICPTSRSLLACSDRRWSRHHADPELARWLPVLARAPTEDDLRRDCPPAELVGDSSHGQRDLGNGAPRPALDAIKRRIPPSRRMTPRGAASTPLRTNCVFLLRTPGACRPGS